MELLLGLTLFGSVLAFWGLVILFIVICFISDLEKNGIFAFFLFIGLIILYHFKSNFDNLLEFFSFAHVSIYLAIGLIYSGIRTFFKGRELGKKIQFLPQSNDSSKRIYDSKESNRKEFVENLKGNVFRWWFMWPVSLINWLVTDLIKDAWDYIYSKLKRMYNYILELGVKSVK